MIYPAWALATSSVWGVVVGGTFAMVHRFARDEKASPGFVAFLTRAAVICFIAVGLIPVATSLMAGAAPESATQHVVATSVGASVVGFVVFLLLQRNHMMAFDMQARRGRSRSRARSLWGGVGTVLMLVSVGNWIWLGVMASVRRGDAILAILGFFALGLAMILSQRRFAGVGVAGATIPLEDSPLAEELRSIATYFGQDPARLRIQTTRSDRSSDEEMTAEQLAVVMRTWRFQRKRQTIPIELIQRVEPREVTAALAFRYALISPPRRDKLVLRIVLFGLGAVALMVGIGMGVGLLQPYLGRAFHVALPIGMAGAMLIITRWLSRAMGLVRSPEQRFVAAHAAWKAAMPDEDRDFVAYVVALLASDRLTMMLGPAADLVPLVHKNIGLVKAAKLSAGLAPNEFLQQLRERLPKPPAD